MFTHDCENSPVDRQLIVLIVSQGIRWAVLSHVGLPRSKLLLDWYLPHLAVADSAKPHDARTRKVQS